MGETIMPQRQNSDAGNHYGTVDRTARIFAIESQSGVIAELERLERGNVEMNDIQGIDDLFIHDYRSASDLLDEMVAEFVLEFPDFDIFNYVDPALNVALDDGATDVHSIIDYEIRQPDVNLNSLAPSGHIEDKNSNWNILFELDVQKKLLAEHREELQSLKNQLQKQQELISELQKQLIFPTIHHRTSNPSQRSLQEQEHQKQEVEPVSTVNERDLILTQRPSENVEADILIEIQLDSGGQPNSQKLDNTEMCKENGIRMLSDDEEELDVVTQQSESVSSPTLTIADEISNHLNARFSLKENKVHSARKRQSDGAGKAKSYRRNAPNVRKRSKSYSCKVCNHRFNRKSDLTAHLRIHAGEKLFERDIGKISFREKQTLSGDMNTHSENEPYECKVCKRSLRSRPNLRLIYQMQYDLIALRTKDEIK